jgi:hypothetical protein
VLTPSPDPEASDLDSAFKEFSLIRGPLDDLPSKWASLIGRGDNLRFLTGLSVSCWFILATLAAIEGYGETFFALGALAVHARMLVAVPLILLCVKLLDQAVHDACAELVRSGTVAGDAKLALDRDAERLAQLGRSRWIQLGLLLAVAAFSLLVPSDYLPGVAIVEAASAPASISMAGLWYWLVCLTLFRFVMVHFFWLLGLWIFLLWRLSRQTLNLTASHPDRAGGLGLLEVAQARLVVFVLALAVIDAAALAASFQNAELDEQQVYLHGFIVAVIGVLVVTGPILPLAGQRFRCRQTGIVEFNAMASTYSVGFRRRWIEPDSPDHGDILGSADIQSLSDLSNSYANVCAMRMLPVDRTLLFVILGCVAVPYAPLLLLKYPMIELITNVLQSALGL